MEEGFCPGYRCQYTLMSTTPVSTSGQTPAPCYLLPEGCVDSGILILVGNQRALTDSLGSHFVQCDPHIQQPLLLLQLLNRSWKRKEKAWLGIKTKITALIGEKYPLPIPSTWSSPRGYSIKERWVFKVCRRQLDRSSSIFLGQR